MARQRTTTPTKPDDARAKRSIEQLSNAFLALLEIKSLDEISIRDITDKSGVSYPTFFRRFDGKDDLLNHIAAEEIRNLLKLSQHTLSNNALNETGKPVCDYIQAHRKLWQTLLNGGAAPAMREEFSRAASEIALSRHSTNDAVQTDLAVRFITSGVFEILAWWLRQPEDYPEENVITLFDTLIIGAANQFRTTQLRN